MNPLLLLIVSAGLAAQNQTRAPQPEPVIRISVTLVQVDAVVTDSRGRQVTDLKAEDFEVRQDGNPQKITNFSYVPVSGFRIASAPAAPGRGPATPLRPEQVRRTMALVVDDIGISYESSLTIRQTLKQYVETQMQPGDLAAIVRTGAGMGALQSFTSDRRQLLAAIERVRWNPQGRVGVESFAPAGRNRGMGPGAFRIEAMRNENLTVDSLASLEYIVGGLRALPGRKSMVVFSENIRILRRDGMQRILESLRKLTDAANRSSVVIYAVDPRGLPVLAATAADALTSGRSANALQRGRTFGYRASQDGLDFLAEETGGLFLSDTNDLSGAMARVLEDQQGYYLLGYTPGEETFNRKFHSIQVRLKRPGLDVRSRNGFYGVADPETAAGPATPRDRMFSALLSPFAAGGVRLRMTALFGNLEKEGSFVESLLHINAQDLKFEPEPDGWYKAGVDVLLATFGDNGQVLDRSSRSQTVRLRDDKYRNALAEGIYYSIRQPVRKPGGYQLRAAVRDSASEKVGSASQFIEVPDVSKGQLALSGILVRGGEPGVAGESEAAAPVVGRSNPALREFLPGQELTYTFHLLNARSEAASRRVRLNTRVQVFQEGARVFESTTEESETGGQTDLKRLVLGGRLKFTAAMKTGAYVLEIAVTDRLDPAKPRTATQWIDFEVSQ